MSAAQAIFVSRGSAAGGSCCADKQHKPSANPGDAKIRVCVLAENRLLREALSRVLTRAANIEVLGQDSFDVEGVLAGGTDVLLLASRGDITEDFEIIRQVRSGAPSTRIVLIGMSRSEQEFLNCVRAGISGYLLRDASSEEVLNGVRAVHAGEAVCPGSLCAALFRFIEHGVGALPLTGVGHRVKLSRRELQLLPLLAEGLTNKEIANRLSRSEQTIKNHLARMKRKLGAADRLELARLYYAEGLFSVQSDSDR